MTKLGMREIARRAGVAPITVSRALSRPEQVSEALRARIMEVVAEAGFIPDRVAGSMRSSGRIIGTVVPPLINSGIAEQVKGMADACAALDHQLLLVQGEFSPEAEDRAITALLGWRPAGLVIQAFVQSRVARERIKRAGLPVVEISEIRGSRPIDRAVGVSNYRAAHAMTMHLARRGYRRIGFVSTPVHGNDRLRQRRVGYRAAIRELDFPPGLEIEVPITPQGGAEALAALAGRDPAPDVIFCSSDTLAIGAIQECHRRGWRVPKRMAVAGYGNLDLAAQMHPALTTVRVDREAMGRRAIDVLINGERDGHVIDVGFEIVERESA
jgi:LacI family gluconate utilization system Gnt-I transcriptional repressor